MNTSQTNESPENMTLAALIAFAYAKEIESMLSKLSDEDRISYENWIKSITT